MGGAADAPDRASSPLKRRAESMEPDTAPDGDVDMVQVPSADDKNGEPDVKQDREDSGEASQDQPMTEELDSAADAQDAPKTVSQPPASIEAHVKSIKTLVEELNSSPLSEGQLGFLVSREWLSKVLPDESSKKDLPEDLSSVGPVDNADIIWEVIRDPCTDKNADSADKYFVRLRSGYNTEQFEVFPPLAWELLMQWPGLKDSQLPIRRYAHNTSDNADAPNVMFEWHPSVFAVHRLWSAHSPIAIDSTLKQKNPEPFKLPRGSSTKYQDLLRQAKSITNVSADQKIRLWTVPQKPAEPSPAGPTPPASPGSGQAAGSVPSPFGHLLVDVVEFTELEKDSERMLVDMADRTTDSKYNGSMTIGTLGITQDQALVLDENIEGTTYVSNYSPSKASAALPTRNSTNSLTAQSRNATSGRKSPSPSGPITRGRTHKSGRTLGCVGLSNLGNTCYMNAALQCVRSVEELTKYFLAKEWKKELNRDNVLAHNGDVAATYAHLLEDFYKDPAPNSITPRQFKNTIGRYAPSFSGYGQQDSQEFLGFLLDGLQEDLSRIKKKPYIEKPDSTDEMIGDPEAIKKMAEQVWDITRKRDDSVIADLFTGLYKSTLVCPDCNKVSITFDPFNNLTLPLPIESKWSWTIKFFPLNDKPIDIRVELDKLSSIKALKEFVSARTGVPLAKLFAAEEFKGKFYKIYPDLACASEEISGSDNAWIYELEAEPTNWGPKAQKQQKYGAPVRSLIDEEENTPLSWNDEQADKLVVPVVHRRPSSGRGVYGHRWQFAAAPHFIVVTPEEARSEDVIRRKIVEKVATLSNHSMFSRNEESDSSENTEPEIIGTSGSEFGSSSDGKIAAQSIQGEDDMVDVRMKDAADTADSAPSHPAKRDFNHTRPVWVDPKEFLPANLQNLFELSFYTESNTFIPSGMHGVSGDKDYPRLSSRAPVESPASEEQIDNATNGTVSNEDSSSDEQSQGQTPEGSSQTRMASESEEDEPPRIVQQSLPQRPKANKFKPVVKGPGGRKKKMKRNKTYGKPGTKKMQQQQKQLKKEQQAQEAEESFEEPPESVADGGPLIRLKEGIVVDWVDDAFENMFGSGDGRGTWDNCETLPDAALDQAQAARTRRKKHGITIEQCLDEFERDEILSEQDMWYCPRCKEHRRASKKFDLWKTPDILVIHLKRFSSSGYRRDKLDVLVDFPIENLDISSRVLHKEDGKQEIYDLIGVDHHYGGLGGGHYTANAKNFVDGQWYDYNDSSVSNATPNDIVNKSAYLLFYRRRSSEPLGGDRFVEIMKQFVTTSEDDALSESGEGQRLGEGGSSLDGSSSALQGVEASRQRQHENSGGDSNMGFVLHRDQGTDDDEGIDLSADENQQSAGFNPVSGTNNWSFQTLTLGAGGDAGHNAPNSPVGSGIATDEAQHDSSGDDRSPQTMDFDSDSNIPGTSHYELSAQPDPPAYNGSHPPSYVDGEEMSGIWDDKGSIHEVSASAVQQQDSDEAAEIHLEEGDKIKL